MTGSANDVRFDTGRADRLNTVAARMVEREQLAGLAWQVSRHRVPIHSGVVGTADHDGRVPLASDAIHRLYSMTKPVVAVAALRLIEAGELRLDDPIDRWLPCFRATRVMLAEGRTVELARPITVEDLLTHRAGLSYDFMPDCPVASLYREARLAEDGARSLADLVECLAALPLAHQPGARFHYSYASDVLARLLEVVADRPLRELLTESLFTPLGMSETDFGVADRDRARLVKMHGLRDLGEVPAAVEPEHALRPMEVERSYPSDRPDTFARGGIGLFSTLDDYGRFAALLLDGRAPSGEALLSAPMLDLLWCNRLPVGQRPISTGRQPMPGYGWGLIGRVMTDLGDSVHLTVPGEGGWSGAASTWFWVDRAGGVTGVVMAQFLGSTIPVGPLMQAAAYQGFVAEPAGGGGAALEA